MKQKPSPRTPRFASWRRDIKWLCGITRPFFAVISLILLLDVLTSLASVACTLINRNLIDSAIGSGGFSPSSLATLIGLTLASLLIGALSSSAALYAGERFAYRLRTKLFAHILKGCWSETGQLHSGDLHARLTTDADTVSSGIISLLPACFHLGFRLLLAFFVLFQFDAVLAIGIVLATPAGLLISLLLGRKLKHYQVLLKENDAATRSYMQESLANVSLYKSFQIEPRADARLHNLYRQRLPLLKRHCKWGILARLAMNLVFSGGYLFALGWGLQRLAQGEITYGTLSVFFSLIAQIQGPLSSLSSLVPQLANMLASTQRLIEVEQIPEEVPLPVEPLCGPIGLRFSHVDFAYAAENVLQDVTLDISPGEILGIVGDSGIGKTTLARLALALITPQAGSVCFYDQSGRCESASNASRRLISYVPQGSSLLSGTVRENLHIGQANATEEDLYNALKICQARFVLDLPEQLDSVISEHAGTLSEGQAQRIAIARALLRGAPVLILDEVTSALDLATESAIIRALRRELAGITCIIITHRPSLLSLCDRCVRIHDGHILECEAQPISGHAFPHTAQG